MDTLYVTHYIRLMISIMIMIRLMLFIMIMIRLMLFIMIMIWGLPVFMDNFNDKSAAPSLSRGRTLLIRHSLDIKSVDFNVCLYVVAKKYLR